MARHLSTKPRFTSRLVLRPFRRRDVGPLEDAALVRPESGSPLAFTVDFITPIVDRPEDFGAIAAAKEGAQIAATISIVSFFIAAFALSARINGIWRKW